MIQAWDNAISFVGEWLTRLFLTGALLAMCCALAWLVYWLVSIYREVEGGGE
jgi:hypothetical protein